MIVRKDIMLVVEDSKLLRTFYRKIFQEDFEIIEASNGKQALNIIEQYGDLLTIVLLDIIMPQLTGIDLLARLQARNLADHIPIIAITSEAEYQLQVLRLGAWDFIIKGSEIEIIKTRVRNVVGRRKFILERKTVEERIQQELDITTKKLRAMYQKKEEALVKLRLSEDRNRLALENSNINIWEYDMKSHRVIKNYDALSEVGCSTIIENVPESLIEVGYVHPDSVEAYRSLYERMHNGEANPSVDVLVKKMMILGGVGNELNIIQSLMIQVEEFGQLL